MVTRTRTGRRPGPARSRDVILDAARRRFAAVGYDHATLRAIAADAGVDPALIRHFFGDKDGLFAATLSPPVALRSQIVTEFETGPDRLGERLARRYLAMWDDPATGPALLAAARTAFTQDEAMERLRALLLDAMAAKDTLPRIAGDRPALRLTLAMSHLLGLALARHVIRTPAAVDADLDELVVAVAPAIDRYLTGELSEPACAPAEPHSKGTT